MDELADVILKDLSLRVSRIITLPFATVESGTYLYPFYGIYYYIIHPDLWAFYLTVLVPQLIFTLLIYIAMFVLFFPIQAAFSTLLTGPIGFFTAWISILQQAGLVSVFLVAFLLMPEIQRITFDAVLSNEFADDVVLLGKLRRIVKVPFWVKCGKLLWAIPAVFVLPYAVAKLLLMMLISTIPFIGPVLVVLLQAPSKGLQAHSRYFVLKGYDKRQVKAIYRANTGAYMGFGIVATILESIPFLSIFFMFTNNIGAALWVVTIEQKQKKEKAAQIKKIHEAN